MKRINVDGLPEMEYTNFSSRTRGGQGNKGGSSFTWTERERKGRLVMGGPRKGKAHNGIAYVKRVRKPKKERHGSPSPAI